MRLLGGCELDTNVTELGVGEFLCSSNLGLGRAETLSTRAVGGSSNFTTHWTIAGLSLAAALKLQWQVWFPLCLGITSGRGEVLRSWAALHKPVAKRNRLRLPNIAARMLSGTPRKSCIYDYRLSHTELSRRIFSSITMFVCQAGVHWSIGTQKQHTL